MQLNYWSLRCSWSIACGHCSNYIFILHLTLGFNILHKKNCKPRRETFKFCDLVRLILDILRLNNYMEINLMLTGDGINTLQPGDFDASLNVWFPHKFQ